MQINGMGNAPQNDGHTPAPGAKGDASVSQMFTTLLVAQIQNQDPLSPMESSQFVTQFAQMSQVEAMDQLASLTAATAAIQESMLVVSLSAHVGSQVMVGADAVNLDGEAIDGGFVLEDPAADAVLVLTGPDGSEHRIELGARDAGQVDFTIDPEALGLPAGRYAMRVVTDTGEAPRTEIRGELEGVRLGANGSVLLSVAGIGDIGVGDITRFLGRRSGTNTLFS